MNFKLIFFVSLENQVLSIIHPPVLKSNFFLNINILNKVAYFLINIILENFYIYFWITHWPIENKSSPFERMSQTIFPLAWANKKVILETCLNLSYFYLKIKKNLRHVVLLTNGIHWNIMATLSKRYNLLNATLALFLFNSCCVKTMDNIL